MISQAKIIMHKISFVKKRMALLFSKDAKVSYAQFGEDLILDTLFSILKIQKPVYLDIGAHHPSHLSNTYLFYKKGSRGVCVEPDPYLANLFKKARPEDTLLQLAVGPSVEDEFMDMYIYEGHAKGLNTLSLQQVNEVAKNSTFKPSHKHNVLVQNINKIILNNFKQRPDLLSIDIEGLDLQILQSLNFSLNAPKVICVELSRWDDEGGIVKNKDLIEFIKSKGYFEYANTFINGIFVENSLQNACKLNWA